MNIRSRVEYYRESVDNRGAEVAQDVVGVDRIDLSAAAEMVRVDHLPVFPVWNRRWAGGIHSAGDSPELPFGQQSA